MNEVRDIVARMLEDPAPPARAPEEVLAIARRANRRRSMLGAAGSGALVLLMVAGVGVAVRSLQHPVPTAAPSVTSLAGQMERAVAAHGAVMAQRIVAALPAGLSAASVETFSDDARLMSAPDDGRVRVLAAAVVRVVSGDQEGEIFAYLVADGAAGSAPVTGGPGGLCDVVAGTAGLESCSVVTVDGVAIRMVTAVEDRCRRIEATRFLTGGRLVVGAWQGPPALDVWRMNHPSAVWYLNPLVEPPDAAFLAGLAADPDMLPA